MAGEGAGALWLALAVEAVFLRVLVGYLRRRDALQGDVMVMFSVLAMVSPDRSRIRVAVGGSPGSCARLSRPPATVPAGRR